MTSETAAVASSEAFRQGMRALAGSVCVVAANGADGAPVGLTATAVTSLSADPPSLIVCVNRNASIAAALGQGAQFSVNLLALGQEEVAQAFGGQKAAKGVARFAFGDWIRSAQDIPLLMGANVSFECEVAQVTDWATHHIVIGLIRDARFAQAQTAALVYHQGRYGSVGTTPRAPKEDGDV
ncbi:MAG TPA: flavin reductase family protein [Beijerinckiaceae bacterium]|nr:flavin reductase family protein [Beijerinckiaceae bacterium]